MATHGLHISRVPIGSKISRTTIALFLYGFSGTTDITDAAATGINGTAFITTTRCMEV
jgi:hypothetical protein